MFPFHFCVKNIFLKLKKLGTGCKITLPIKRQMARILIMEDAKNALKRLKKLRSARFHQKRSGALKNIVDIARSKLTENKETSFVNCCVWVHQYQSSKKTEKEIYTLAVVAPNASPVRKRRWMHSILKISLY